MTKELWQKMLHAQKDGKCNMTDGKCIKQKYGIDLTFKEHSDFVLKYKELLKEHGGINGH